VLLRKKINRAWIRIKKEYKAVLNEKKRLFYFVLLLLIFSFSLPWLYQILENSTLSKFQSTEKTLLKHFSDFNLKLKYDTKASSETPIYLKFYSDSNIRLSFIGKIGGKEIKENLGVGQYGTHVGAFPPTYPPGKIDFNVLACTFEKECKEYAGTIVIYSYENLQFNLLGIRTLFLILFIIFIYILFLELKEIRLLSITKMYFMMGTSTISPLFIYISGMFNQTFAKFLIQGALLWFCISILLLMGLLLTEKKASFKIICMFLSLLYLFIFYFHSPRIAYITVLFIFLMYFLTKEKSLNKEGQTKFGKYTTIIIGLLGILFSSFVFYPIVQPLIGEHTKYEEVVISNFSENALLINHIEMKIKKPLIGIVPFGTDEIKVPVGNYISQPLFVSNCAKIVGTGVNYLRIKLETPSLTECEVKITYFSRDAEHLTMWLDYIAYTLKSENFSETYFAKDGNKIVFYIWRLKYNGKYQIISYPFKIKEYRPSIVTINGKIKSSTIIDNHKYVNLNLIPNENYLIVQVVGAEKITNEIYDELKRIIEMYG